jgi:carbon storage regulator
MLVLARQLGERLYIGSNITVTVTAIQGNRVKLGIDAPGNVSIIRAELGDFWRKPAAVRNAQGGNRAT